MGTERRLRIKQIIGLWIQTDHPAQEFVIDGTWIMGIISQHHFIGRTKNAIALFHWVYLLNCYRIRLCTQTENSFPDRPLRELSESLLIKSQVFFEENFKNPI